MKLNKNTDYEKRAKFIASLTLVIILILLVVFSFFLEPKVELKSLQSNSIYVTQYIVRVDDNVQQANKVEQNTKLNSQSEEIKHEDTSLRKMITENSTNKLEVIEQQKFEVKKEIKTINKEKQAQKIKTVQKKIEVKKVKSKTETSEKTKSIKKEITNFDKKKDVSNSQNKNIIKEQKEKQITKQSLDIEFNNNSNTAAVSNSNDNVNNSSLNGNDITRPYQRTEFLAAEVCAAGQRDDIVSADGFEAVICHFGVVIRIKQRHHIAPAGVPNQIVEMFGVNFGLCFVEPESVNAVVDVVFFQLAPYISSGSGIGDIDLTLPAVEIKNPVAPAGGAHEHIVASHVVVVFTVFIDGRPNGNHKLCVHSMQLFGHGLHIGPVFGVEFVVALLCPMEIIGDDD